MFQLEVWQESSPSFLQWCGQNVCLDSKRLFLDTSHCLAPSSLASVLPPSVLHLCKNHKFVTCRLGARDDNLGVLLSDPPCTTCSVAVLPGAWKFRLKFPLEMRLTRDTSRPRTVGFVLFDVRGSR